VGGLGLGHWVEFRTLSEGVWGLGHWVRGSGVRTLGEGSGI